MDLHDQSTVAGISSSQRVVGAWLPITTPQGGTDPAARWVLLGRWAAGNAVRIIPICDSPFRIGRGEDLHLSLPSLAVSRAHAELIDTGTALHVRDLSSRNGTFVNGCRVQQIASVGSDAVIQFADIQFRVCCWNGNDTR